MLISPCRPSEVEESDGGWLTDPLTAIAKSGPCNIEVRGPDLSPSEFLSKYAYTVPVVIRGAADNSAFRNVATKSRILEKYGDKKIILSTANTHSHEKVTQKLADYINELKPQSLNRYGNETFYWFGDHDFKAWQEFFDIYRPPPYHLPGKTSAYSFGIAGPGTGVPFHQHGPGFAEVIYGSKRWFFYPPKENPTFNPDKSSLHWLVEEYANLPSHKKPLECTVGPNEVIYFPHWWWHSTLNVNTSVFISTFLA
ncbi:jmjC domain-containing protein 8-like [Lineus longissimus]|uniref:jmjC domain-containing protein 8-like n=1 Tax=Lineus longissimus TaxID=88925 RepID=UPI002B4E0C08